MHVFLFMYVCMHACMHGCMHRLWISYCVCLDMQFMLRWCLLTSTFTDDQVVLRFDSQVLVLVLAYAGVVCMYVCA
jgi:hypothetical protein